jgi:hypothetical protein
MPFTRLVLSAALVLWLALLPGCRSTGNDPAPMSAPVRPIEQVLAEHSPKLMAMPGVTAVGQGELDDHTPCIRVWILAHDAELERKIPKRIEGHPVVVEVSGEIRALPESRK